MRLAHVATLFEKTQQQNAQCTHPLTPAHYHLPSVPSNLQITHEDLSPMTRHVSTGANAAAFDRDEKAGFPPHCPGVLSD